MLSNGTRGLALPAYFERLPWETFPVFTQRTSCHFITRRFTDLRISRHHRDTPVYLSGPIDHPGINAICLPCLVGLHNSPRQRSAGKADGPAAEGGFLPAQDRSFGDLAAEADRK